MKKSKSGPIGKIEPLAVYDVEGAAQVVGMRPRTVLQYIREGKIVAQRAGKEYRMTGNNLLSYLGTAVWPVEASKSTSVDNRGAITTDNYEEHR